MKKKFKSFIKKDTKRQNITGKNPRYSWKRNSKGVKNEIFVSTFRMMPGDLLNF